MRDPHGTARIYAAGAPLEQAAAALVLIHGRGAPVSDILSLGAAIAPEGFALLAPEATGSTWYPHSFLRPTEMNQPHLDSALVAVGRVVAVAEEAGFRRDQIAVGGFSQGACLTAEFLARNPARWGAGLVLSGGLIGLSDDASYEGDLAGTPIFLGCSDVDAHIPLERVQESTKVLQGLGADVTERIYPGMGHTVNEDEASICREMLGSMV